MGFNFDIAVNTSLSEAEICLFNKDGLIDRTSWTKQSSHSEVITDAFIRLLEKRNLDLSSASRIHCVIGPGSFTGIRVGVNFCKSLAYALDIPVVPINTLDLYASQCDRTDKNIISCIDAQKNSLFLSEYKFSDGRLHCVTRDDVVKVDRLDRFFDEEKFVCGDGLTRYAPLLSRRVLSKQITQPQWQQSRLSIYWQKGLFLADDRDWSLLQPVYIKASAAEEKRKSN